MKRKVYSALLSFVVAFGLWLYVFNNVSQEDDSTFYNIPIVMTGENVLSERNLMITGISAEAVSLNISGARSELNKLDNSNIIVKADLSGIDEAGDHQELKYSVDYTADVSKSAFTVQQKNPQSIFVDVDVRRTKEIDVVVKWTGTRSENYIYDTDNPVMDYTTVTVVGPAAVADRIDHAQIEVDLTDRYESISEDFRYTLCDVDGEPVDAQQIVTNVEQIHLDAKIQKIKVLNLVANILYGGGATADNTTVEVQPETIRVSGSEAVLEELGDSLMVCTINMAELEKTNNENLKYTITLPEGVTNETGVTEALVTVKITGVNTREYTITNFQSINVPEGMEAEIINANLVVKVRGPAAQMMLLATEDIAAVVDFAAAEPGTATYKATITFPEGFETLGALKTYSVSAEVRELEE